MTAPLAGGARPSPATDRRALQPYIKVQQATDRQMLGILRDALRDVNRELRKLERKEGVGALIRAEQFAQTKVAIFLRMSEVWTNAGDLVRAGRYRAAAAGVESTGIYDKVLFQAAGREAEYALFVKGMKAYATNAIDLGALRLTTSRIELSQNVYRASSLANGQLERELNALLSRGSSAREIAKAASGFIDPNTPGGLSYAAMRLGRTELNNAFHASQAMSMARQPWVLASQWNLSSSHLAPDECDDYASSTDFNGEAGQYSTNEIPGNPHPQCLCFLTPVLMDQDAFLNSLNGGAFDAFDAA